MDVCKSSLSATSCGGGPSLDGFDLTNYGTEAGYAYDFVITALPIQGPEDEEPQNEKEEPKGDLKQCLLGVGGKLLEGALDPVGVLANGAASVAVSAGYDIAKYNASAGGIIAETGVKLAPSGGAISRWSIARASGALAGKLFVAGTAIVAVGYASVYAWNSQDCRPH